MADTPIAGNVAGWMKELQWGPHHDQWHFERRWDFWHYYAQQGEPDMKQVATEMIAYADQQGWQRAELQEGQPGNGLEFLGMHRAMMQLILEHFPDAGTMLRGWNTPPTDPKDANDPVPDGSAFEPGKAEGTRVIETEPGSFSDDDAFGRFLQTNLRPTADDPTYRDPDARLNLHNYLHNRWTDEDSPINLGDPKVNLFNSRFWSLHGWIDRQWTRYRAATSRSDEDPAYLAIIAHYKHMMGGHMHPMVVTKKSARSRVLPRPRGFSRFSF